MGVPYYSGYDPILDRHGHLIGILYVGAKQSEVLDALSRGHELRFYIPGAAVALVSAFFLFLGSKLTQEIEKRKTSLETTHPQLDAALASMPNGLSLWSPRGLLILTNQRLCKVLDLSPGELQTGMSYQDFLRARHNAGNFGEKPDLPLADRLGLTMSGQAGSHIDVSVNGKVVIACNAPLAMVAGFLLMKTSRNAIGRMQK